MEEEDAYPDLSVVVRKDFAKSEALAKELQRFCYRDEKYVFHAKQIKNFFEESNYLLTLEFEDGERLGFLLLQCYPRQDSAKIVLVCIDENEAGENLSDRLLNKAKEIAKEAGNAFLELEAVNERVAQIYEAKGFKRKATGLFMTLQLGSSRLHKKARRTRRNRKLTTRRQKLVLKRNNGGAMGRHG